MLTAKAIIEITSVAAGLAAEISGGGGGGEYSGSGVSDGGGRGDEGGPSDSGGENYSEDSGSGIDDGNAATYSAASRLNAISTDTTDLKHAAGCAGVEGLLKRRQLEITICAVKHTGFNAALLFNGGSVVTKRVDWAQAAFAQGAEAPYCHCNRCCAA
jgi:hypothetical protein